MTKKQRIEQLEAQLRSEERKSMNLEKQVNALAARLKTINESLERNPEGCKPGAWCRYCGHGKYIYHVGLGNGTYICNLANVCSNFIPKEDVEVKK